MSFWIGRITHALFALWAVSVLTFMFLELAPGDYVDQIRLNPQISEATRDAMRQSYGLDRPFAERYVKWLGSVIRGTWGFSFSYGGPVAPLVWRRALNTLVLGISATLVAWIVAVPVGVFWATRRKRTSRTLDLATSMMLGVPELVLALLLLVVAERSGAFPIGGMASLDAEALPFSQRIGDLLWHLVLPVSALALPSFAMLVRHVRVAVERVLREPFVTGARAVGTRRPRLLVHSILRPAANPLISIAGLSVASLLSASFIVEVVMGWPGLGPFLLTAIRARDVYVVIGGVMCSAVLVVGGGLATDLVLYCNDPRIAER